MTGQINMGSKITNLATPTNNTDATNKVWVENQITNNVGTVVTKQTVLEEKLKEYTIDSHSLKDEFRYLMENFNESSSENGIRVDGIGDLKKSPHKVNKKAYNLKLTKHSSNNYVSRLGFNMYKLPEGEYTICVEFLPVTMANVSVNAVSSSLNAGLQTTTTFTKGRYTRSIIHMHKYKISPPEYLMLDLHCRGSRSSPALGQAYLIIYGVSDYHSDVHSSVFDQAFVLKISGLVMQTYLNMNNHPIINSPSLRSVFAINGVYNKSVDHSFVQFSGGEQVMVPVNCKIVKCKIKITETLSSYSPVTVKINNKIVTGTNTRKQSYNIDLNLQEDDTFKVQIIQSGGGLQSSVNLFSKCVVSLLLETT